jgi:hypothetical protein
VDPANDNGAYIVVEVRVVSAQHGERVPVADDERNNNNLQPWALGEGGAEELRVKSRVEGEMDEAGYVRQAGRRQHNGLWVKSLEVREPLEQRLPEINIRHSAEEALQVGHEASQGGHAVERVKERGR